MITKQVAYETLKLIIRKGNKADSGLDFYFSNKSSIFIAPIHRINFQVPFKTNDWRDAKPLKPVVKTEF